jgi:hypothetical protein
MKENKTMVQEEQTVRLFFCDGVHKKVDHCPSWVYL